MSEKKENTSLRLNNANLPAIAQALPDISFPKYDRAKLSPGIIHIGLGNFHRAHQSWYLHRLMQMGLAQDWGIIGAGVRRFDEHQRQKLASQDYLTTLIELDPLRTSAEVVGSMIDYVEVQQGNRPLIEQMSTAEIRIVAMTVTEGGYYIDPASQNFDATHPDIIHDAQNPEKPRTVFGALIAALKLRREREIIPFTALCCDNLQENGEVLRQTVVSLARLSDPELADWINDFCSFPNSMVDCIVPSTGPNELAMAKALGVDDVVPVTHEPFRQWVIEDKFCAGRPDWDKVGAIFTDSVADYEAMKIRMLNAGHQVLANAGELLRKDTVADCMADPLLADFFSKVEREEIAPYVKSISSMTPDAYFYQTAQRFSNPAILDTIRRIAFDGSSRHAGFILPTLRNAIETDGPVQGLSLVEALWARMCVGTREDGSLIEANDPFWEQLQKTALRAKSNPLAWLEMRQTYGDLADNPRFAKAFVKWLTYISDRGVEAALKRYCQQPRDVFTDTREVSNLEKTQSNVTFKELCDIIASHNSDKRIVIAIAGPPGCGKSTMAELLQSRLTTKLGLTAQIIPMDGFHYDNKILKQFGISDKKGAPQSFDVEGLKFTLERLSESYMHEDVAIPTFDRDNDFSRSSARLIYQGTSVLLVEGNYLLMNKYPWTKLSQYFDLTSMIVCDEDKLRERLIDRWVDLKHSDAEATAKVEGNDLYNAKLVIEYSNQADYTLAT